LSKRSTGQSGKTNSAISDTSPHEPPSGCPFKASENLLSLRFTGRHCEYTSADTWYLSWASNDCMYSGWTDGSFCEEMKFPFECMSFARIDEATGNRIPPATGNAKISGSDQMNLTLEHLGLEIAEATPYQGRYPAGSLVHDGVWYYGTYCLNQTGKLSNDGKPLNWDVLGPFVGFRISRNFGKTWQEGPNTPEKPIFGEKPGSGTPVIFGAPHFVDFGKNMEHSPDGLAYLVGHGSALKEGRPAWIKGDQVHLCRVKPSEKTINDAAAYEFFAGLDEDKNARWDRGISNAKPVIEWQGKIGHVAITYVAPLNRYLMCVTDGGNTIEKYNSYILEADNVHGPWRIVSYLKDFGEQGYFLNVPSKFISKDGKSAWLCYSANFTNHYLETSWEAKPKGSRYALCLQEFTLDIPTNDVAEKETEFQPGKTGGGGK